MSDIRIEKDMKLIKVLAAQAKGERIDSNDAAQADEIMNTIIAEDLNKESAHRIAETVAFTVNEMQQHDLDFLGQMADIKNINYGQKAAFNVRTGHVKAYTQAKGSTTARSQVGSRQILVDTQEIAARPSISIMDLKTGRVDRNELIREANREMTNAKLQVIEKALQTGISSYASPFYGTGSGVVKATLDAQLNYFRRLGPVTLLGDIAAAGKLAPLVGMAMNSTTTQFSPDMINEANDNAFIGMYNGARVITLNNAYEVGTTTPILNPDWLYIIPGGISADMRNLKVVNEGTVNTMEQQMMDDRAYDILLYQWFGAHFVVGEFPTAGAYHIA